MLRQVRRGERAAAGRDYEPINYETMDNENQPKFAERIKLLHDAAHNLRHMADAIKSAAEVVLAEAQHMDTAAKRFTERAGRRKSGGNVPAPTR